MATVTRLQRNTTLKTIAVDKGVSNEQWSNYEEERAELEAAEKGIRLTRPATDKRQTEFHQRIHQATVEYLRRKALGERVSQLQLADEYDISPHMIKWRLRIYRGYDARKHQEEY